MHWNLNKQLEFVKQMTKSLVLENEQLCSIAQQFDYELNCSLSGLTEKSMQVYPTFIHQVPDGNEHGHYLALDLGGTNFRVLLIELQGHRQSHVVTETYSISQELMQSEGRKLFDYIALCVFNFVKQQGLLALHFKLGFTFSFPCHQSSLKKALLSKWTKGFSCSGVVGQDIVEMLKSSLYKYDSLHIEVAAIVNDTAGTLISCSFSEPDCRMGVIVGTGVNVCYMESNCFDKEMIINTELGAFGSNNQSLDCVLTEWDKQVDKHSINSGQQLFEKMVSGMYLGEIVRTIVVDLMQKKVFDPAIFGSFEKRNSFPTSLISRVELDAATSDSFINTFSVFEMLSISGVTMGDCAALHLICSRVSRRSAHLTSAVIASLLARMDRPMTVVGVDGSVYRCHPHYRTAINDKVGQLLPLLESSHTHFRLMLSEDGSGRGAALVACLPDTDQTTEAARSKCKTCKESNCPLPGRRRCALTV